MKHLRRKCESCRQVFDVCREGDGYYDPRTCTGKIFVTWRADPFAEEIHDDYTRMWLCDYCAYEHAMEI